ncbi:MAG TPA: hypothetical protein G4O18_02330 [Dehalococcoidia bacterium]|nr:hypothetical protein [Dehalococcoidia bacterium]
MPTIRIDEDVYSWLKSQAVPFKDTPNSVLRRLAGLDTNKRAVIETRKEKKGEDKMITAIRTSGRRLTGKLLNDLWEVHARHALYHKDGTFFENLRDFPGALFDAHGYMIFQTEQEYNNCPYLDIGQKLNIHKGISSIPGYRRMS